MPEREKNESPSAGLRLLQSSVKVQVIMWILLFLSSIWVWREGSGVVSVVPLKFCVICLDSLTYELLRMHGGIGGRRGWFRYFTKCAGCKQALLASIFWTCSALEQMPFKIYFFPNANLLFLCISFRNKWDPGLTGKKHYAILGHFLRNLLCSKVCNTVAAKHSNYLVMYAESFLLRKRLGHGSNTLKEWERNGSQYDIRKQQLTFPEILWSLGLGDSPGDHWLCGISICIFTVPS